MAKRAFKVLSPVKLDSDTTVMPGETVEIEEKHAKELLDLTAVEPAAKDVSGAKPSKGGGGA